MVGLDTNVLVRYLVRDDEAQFTKAQKFIKQHTSRGNSVLISQIVLLETEWVLRSRYGIRKTEMSAVFSAMLDSTDIDIEDEATLEEALFVWRDSRAEFADCLIGARYRSLGCTLTATFDEKASSLSMFAQI